MGNVYAHRRRVAPAILLTGLAVLAVAAFLALTAGPASAQQTFTVCASCHGSAKHSSNPTHAGLYSSSACATCHVNGFSAENKGVTPAACAACHGGTTTILARATHTGLGCGTTAGCHGVPSPTPTSTGTPTPSPTPTATAVATTVTARATPTTIRLRKTVKTTGAVTPVATLAGKKVALRVDFKKGAKWVKAKTASATVTATGTYSWKYKPLKKGTFRVKASIAAKTGVYKASKTAYKTFKVK